MKHAPLTAPFLLALVPALGHSALASGGWPSGANEIVSLAHDGTLGSERCRFPAMSADGRRIAFETRSQLLPQDTNDYWDIYVFDRETGILHGASTPTGGAQFGNANSYRASISGDGRYVVYESGSSNLAPLDPNGWYDVYMKDLLTGVTTRISNAAGSDVASNGASRRPSISHDGRYVAFHASGADLGVLDTNNALDIYRHDTWSGTNVRFSEAPGGEADGNSADASISADGSRIAFRSWATNLIAGDGNGYSDIFVVEEGGLPLLASRTPLGGAPDSESSNPKIAADGTHVAFVSWASDIAGAPGDVELDVFVTNLDTLDVEVVSVAPDGSAGGGAHDQAISADGRYVAFTGLVNGFAPHESPYFDVFVRDMQTGTTWTAGRPSGTSQVSNDGTGTPVLSADGRTIAFVGVASNLVPGLVDDNGQWDIFVRTMRPTGGALKPVGGPQLPGGPGGPGAGPVTGPGAEPVATAGRRGLVQTTSTTD